MHEVGRYDQTEAAFSPNDSSVDHHGEPSADRASVEAGYGGGLSPDIGAGDLGSPVVHGEDANPAAMSEATASVPTGAPLSEQLIAGQRAVVIEEPRPGNGTFAGVSSTEGSVPSPSRDDGRVRSNVEANGRGNHENEELGHGDPDSPDDAMAGEEIHVEAEAAEPVSGAEGAGQEPPADGGGSDDGGPRDPGDNDFESGPDDSGDGDGERSDAQSTGQRADHTEPGFEESDPETIAGEYGKLAGRGGRNPELNRGILDGWSDIETALSERGDLSVADRSTLLRQAEENLRESIDAAGRFDAEGRDLLVTNEPYRYGSLAVAFMPAMHAFIEDRASTPVDRAHMRVGIEAMITDIVEQYGSAYGSDPTFSEKGGWGALSQLIGFDVPLLPGDPQVPLIIPTPQRVRAAGGPKGAVLLESPEGRKEQLGVRFPLHGRDTLGGDKLRVGHILNEAVLDADIPTRRENTVLLRDKMAKFASGLAWDAGLQEGNSRPFNQTRVIEGVKKGFATRINGRVARLSAQRGEQLRVRY